jgi:membrane-bound ClpP family serine protease
MWLIAGLLLGAAGLAFLTSFHTQLHGHIATAVFGLAAAGWLIAMVVAGHASALLWLLFGLDISLSIGTGTLAYRGFISPNALAPSAMSRLVGTTGVAMTPLTPTGTVRVNGESWSAESLDGEISQGAQIQVTALRGIRLEVVSSLTAELPPGFFELDPKQVPQPSPLTTEEESP